MRLLASLAVFLLAAICVTLVAGSVLALFGERR